MFSLQRVLKFCCKLMAGKIDVQVNGTDNWVLLRTDNQSERINNNWYEKQDFGMNGLPVLS